MSHLALLDAFFAERSGSREELRGAIVSLQDAAAMHQRACWSAPKASETASAHHATVEQLNARVRELRRVRPTTP